MLRRVDRSAARAAARLRASRLSITGQTVVPVTCRDHDREWAFALAADHHMSGHGLIVAPRELARPEVALGTPPGSVLAVTVGSYMSTRSLLPATRASRHSVRLIWHVAEMGDRPDSTVDVVPYRSEWKAEFERTAEALSSAVGGVALSIEHIGSTAVPGLAAKPTIDILMVVRSPEEFLAVLPSVEALGFDYRSKNTFVGSEDHLFLRKVKDGKRTHHLHVVRVGSAEIEEYRRFRDALRGDPALAREYERLKCGLAETHASDRMQYVEAKSRWVDERLRSLPPGSE